MAGRPSQNPNARFSDVRPIWESALANDGIMWHTDTNNAAIKLTFRLNTYRRVVRENSPDGFIIEDLYIVSRIDNKVLIKKRAVPKGFMTTLDGGTPLTPEQQNERFLQNMRELNNTLDLDLETE